jgi:hypothetical protein
MPSSDSFRAPGTLPRIPRGTVTITSRYGSRMSAQPDSGPAPGVPYEVIHLGGEAAAIVPLAEFRRLRALARIASPQELAKAEEAARTEELDAIETRERTGELSDQQARQILGVPARQGSEGWVTTDEVRRQLGLLPR